jgi:DNA-binding NarL/FixJ family response regulator
LRVLLATDNKELDDYLKKHTDIDVSGEVYYREALVDSLRQNKCDTVILSVFLNGEEDMLDIVFQLRMADARVIMLMGDTGKTDTKVFELVAMGVYDILFSPISVSEIVKTVNEPKNLSHILNELNAPWRPESKTLISKFKAFMRRKPKDEEAKSEVVAVEEVQVETKIVKKADKKPTGSKAVPSYSFFNLTNSLAKDNKEKRHKKSKIDIIEEPAKTANNDYKARAIAVMGTAKKVGSTSFAIALTKALVEKGNKVRIVDVGGGAKKWLRNDDIECSNDIGILPGTITVFDMGRIIPDGVLPFAEHVFIVTDNGPDANPTIIMPYVAAKTYLIGTKGMDEDILYALADLKMVKALFSLPETSELIIAKQKGVGIIPKKWQKSIEKAVQVVEKSEKNKNIII